MESFFLWLLAFLPVRSLRRMTLLRLLIICVAGAAIIGTLARRRAAWTGSRIPATAMKIMMMIFMMMTDKKRNVCRHIAAIERREIFCENMIENAIIEEIGVCEETSRFS